MTTTQILTTWIIPLVSVLITIAFGVYAISSAKAQSRQLGQTLTKSQEILFSTERVFQHLTTRYIGSFPNFFKNICDCIDSAETEILVACDVPAYGTFSSRKLCNQYLTILRNKQIDGVSVKIVTLSLEMKNWLRDRAGNTYANLPQALGDENFAQCLDAFNKSEKVQIQDFQQLREALTKIHDRTLDDPSLASEKYMLNAPMPIYCWIADGKRAVFAIPSWAGDIIEHGFETRDESLCKALVSAWELYVERATKL